jgi:hypothetical protein
MVSTKNRRLPPDFEANLVQARHVIADLRRSRMYDEYIIADSRKQISESRALLRRLNEAESH